MPKAVVAGVIFKKQVNLTQGTFYSFVVSFANGDQGEYLAKNNPQTFFVQGQEAEYEITKNEQGYYKIKPVRAQQGGGFKPVNPVHENKRVALKCTVDLVCAKIITENQMKSYYTNFLKQLNDEGT